MSKLFLCRTMTRHFFRFLVVALLSKLATSSKAVPIWPCVQNQDFDEVQVVNLDWNQGPVGIIQTPDFPHQVKINQDDCCVAISINVIFSCYWLQAETNLSILENLIELMIVLKQNRCLFTW
jgi:hypothetical protein